MSYQMENAKRDRIYGNPKANTRVNTHDLADKVCISVTA